MIKIHYICHYHDVLAERDLVTQPSGITKINYIKSTLKKAGFYVSVFSVAQATTLKRVNYSAKTKIMDFNEDISYIHSFGRPNIIFKLFSRVWMQIQLLFYLFFRVKSADKVLVYHSLVLRWPVKIIRLLTKKRIFIEVEELYHAVLKSSVTKLQKEIKYLHNADGYILVNDLIAEKCGFLNKPFAVCYGDYRMSSKKKGSFFDKNIHLVYAGVIAGSDSDVYLALETVRHLPNNYRLHVLGYGLPEDIILMKRRIHELNSSLGNEFISYYGCLSGNEYYSFLSKCDIGLCTRVLVDEFSVYTFPSKVLVYLGNNLIPICSPISSVINSQVRKYVVFTKDITPQAVADSVLSIQKNKNGFSGDILNQLDEKFVKTLAILFSS